MFSPSYLLFASAFLCLFQHSSTATFCASSCGNITIDSPFRLITDPPHCGNKLYELACQDNALLMYVNDSLTAKVVGYPVRAINYNNFTIRVVDPNIHMDNCTLQAFETGEHTNWYYWYNPHYRVHLYSTYMFIFVSCPYPMTGSLEVYNSPCNLKRYWHLRVQNYTDYTYGNDLRGSELENGCRIEGKYWTSLLPGGAKNISYIDVINSLAHGFELSWASACCDSEVSRKYNCSRDRQYFYCERHPFSEELFWGIINCSVYILTIYAMYKGLLCFCGTPCVTIFLMYKWRRRHSSAYDNIEEFLYRHQNDLMPVRYSYSQIKKMTKVFKEKLGEGGYGSVYKGKLQSGRFAAVKMLNKSKSNGQEFINEVATIGRIHHTNVVQLIGFCVEGSKHALVYEFMVNGSLDKYVFSKEGCTPINDEKIYDISLGVAHGIKYLHQGCNMQILHFDIKPHNILLDENLMPKISDFGLAKFHTTDNSVVSLTAARGTIGYMAPELFYRNIGGISYKADVYSFGMLLMEMVGRRKNLNAFTEHSSRIYFPSWIYDQIREEKDVKLEQGSEENNLVKKMIIVALWCIQLNPTDRPSMHKVIEMLEGDVEHLPMPPKPFVTPNQEAHTIGAGLNASSEVSVVDTSCYHSDTICLLIEEE